MKIEKLSTDPFRAIKKPERKVGKGKGKETRPGSCKNPPRPRARKELASFASGRPIGLPTARCARTLPTARNARNSRYHEAGAAADELIDILGGNRGNDRGTWGYYCYHHDIETILEKAREIASRHCQGELKWPIRAFQRWLQRSYGRVGQ